MFCSKCGNENADDAKFCKSCGTNLVSTTSSSLTPTPTNRSATIPVGVKGWSWGAFFLNWIWAIGNRTWIGLLALIPFAVPIIAAIVFKSFGVIIFVLYFGFIMPIVLGIKGREWAWRNNDWESVEHFNMVQRKWSIWGLLIGLALPILVGLIVAKTIPENRTYQSNVQEQQQIVSGSPVKLTATDVQFVKGEYGNIKLTGKIANMTGVKLSYVQVDINLFDESGAQIGSTLATANNFEPWTVWKFEAPVMNASVQTAKVVDISAF